MKLLRLTVLAVISCIVCSSCHQSRIVHGFRSMDGFGGKRSGAHSGVDFHAAEGDPVIAAAPGHVVSTMSDPEAGNAVLIAHVSPGGLAGSPVIYYTSYLHLSAIDVREGEPVRRGERIGRAGATGSNAAGTPHVHFQLCTYPCKTGTADGDLEGVLDPISRADGCFDRKEHYADDRLTYPVLCETVSGDAAQIVSSMQAAYGRIDVLKARVRLRGHFRRRNVVLSSEGTLRMRRDDGSRWDLENAAGRRSAVVSHGHEVHHVDHDDRTIAVVDVDKSPLATAADFFALDLATRYVAEIDHVTSYGSGDVVVIKLTSKLGDRFGKAVYLAVSTDDYMVHTIAIDDIAGNIIEIELLDLQYGPTALDDEFDFTVDAYRDYEAKDRPDGADR